MSKEEFVYRLEFKCENSNVLEEQLFSIERFVGHELPKDILDVDYKIEVVHGIPHTILLSISCHPLNAIELTNACCKYFNEQICRHNNWLPFTRRE